MITEKSKIRKVGGSWMVVIDKKIADYEGYKLGDEVDVFIKKIDAHSVNNEKRLTRDCWKRERF